MSAPSDPAEIQSTLWAGWDARLGWDVGANDGESTARMVTMFGQVHSFEPCEESFTLLARRWRYLSQVVHLHYLAVADHDGTLETAVREGPITSGQLVAVQDDPGDDIPLPPGAAGWGREIGRRTVPCLTLDTLAYGGPAADAGAYGIPQALPELGVPDFVKIDTEGHEAQILTGAPRLLAEGRTGWLIEFHSPELHQDCTRLLQAAGYEPQTVRHPHYPPGSRMWHQHGWIRARAPQQEPASLRRSR